jgi:ElaB/YqjD/DUF883 family membrane-anchored ribosome-binding protein
MAEEPEVIKHDIDETATDLKTKVEQLEEKVLGTVKGTTDAVSETVESVKETVRQTIDTVRETVEDTVQSVKRTIDLRYQVDRHPWLMMSGSVVAGFAAGKLVGSLLSPKRTYPLGNGRFYSPAPPDATGIYETMRGRPAAAKPQRERSEPGLISRLMGNFDTEINKVKGMAIGALFGFLRDMAKESLPASLSDKVDEVMNSVTAKLGGEPIRGPVTEAFAGAGTSDN